jgi:hypothetical protein
MGVSIGDLMDAIKALKTQLAPIPQLLAVLGQMEVITGTVNAALSLPAGGMWWWFVWYLTSTNAMASWASNWSGISAGGTQIAAAPGAGQYNQAMIWRIT